jgi:DNA repair protein RecO
MSEPIVVTGLVLSVAPQSEYDRRLVLLTKERGKISAFARGARKSNSALLAATNAFVFGTFTLYEGRTSYTLIQATVKEYFTELAKVQPSVYYGFYFLELASYYAREGIEETAMINLLYISLKALLKENMNNQLIKVIFELKTMVINGEYPQTFACLNCGVQEDLVGISISRSSVYCKECLSVSADMIKLTPAALYTMQYIISTSLERLYTFAVSSEVLTEIEIIMKQYVNYYIDKSFKTLEILKMMC